jgi:hypothetical protein
MHKSEQRSSAPATVVAAAGWYAVSIDALLPLIKVMRAAASAEQLQRQIGANLAAQRDPEFCNIVVVRDASELDQRVPRWVSAFLQHFWAIRRGG